MKKKQHKQKLLVLIDFTKISYRALKYAISLAKVINGKIILLYVVLPRELVNDKNYSAGLKTQKIDKNKAEAQLKSIIEMIEAEKLSAEYINTTGNFRTKLDECTTLFEPNLVVLGKSKNSTNQLGEATEYLLNQNNGNVLIISGDHEFREDTQISMEGNGESLNDQGSDFLLWLNEKTTPPICVFINHKKTVLKEVSLPKNWAELKKANFKICYKTKHCFSTIDSIKKHILDEKIELVCIARKRLKTSFFANLFSQHQSTKEFINNIDIPVLIMGQAS